MLESRRQRATVESSQRCAWLGTSLLVTNPRGSCGAGDPLTGFFFREARHLRTLELTLNGEPPWLCASGQGAARTLAFVFAHPELSGGGAGGSGQSGDDVEHDGHGIARRALELILEYDVDLNALDVALRVHNRSDQPVTLDVAWTIDADFADLLDALADQREHPPLAAAAFQGNVLELRSGAAGLPLGTCIAARGPGAWTHADGRLTARLELSPRGAAALGLHIAPQDSEGVLHRGAVTARRRHVQQWLAATTRVAGPGGDGDSLFAGVTNAAMEDLGALALLDGAADEWLAPAAGVPLYPALFGRDAVTTSWQAASLDRGALLDATLTRLGRLQGAVSDPTRDEQPGRIVQQVRRGPLSRAARNPFDRYYGDVASPLLFVLSLGHLYAWTGDREALRRHWDAARRVLDWARDYGDRDRDGYIEYHTTSAQGPKHQGWKDSGDAIVYPDGRLVATPVAAAEIQGYWYAAQQIAAVLSLLFGARHDARAYWRSAKELKQRFNRDFWLPDERCPALALDPEKRPVATVASNGGHCLACGILSAEHVRATAGRLFAPDMFSGWGIRTLSSAHPSYHPISYHRGSVWAVENATIVFGLRRFGLNDRALELIRAQLDLAALFDGHRIPECVGGYARAELPHPGAYPRANPVQAWNQSAFPFLLQTMLGLQPWAALRVLFVDPVLPPWLPEITLHDLRVGDAMATIRFRRTRRGRTRFRVLRKSGTLRILRQPPPESLNVGVVRRIAAFAAGVVRR